MDHMIARQIAEKNMPSPASWVSLSTGLKSAVDYSDALTLRLHWGGFLGTRGLFVCVGVQCIQYMLMCTHVWHLWSIWSVCWGWGAEWQSRHCFWLDSLWWLSPPPLPRCCPLWDSGFVLQRDREKENWVGDWKRGRFEVMADNAYWVETVFWWV